LEAQIFIHEPLFDDGLHQVLVESHLAILPSHIEAFGLAFAEAQAAGLPVIGYASGSLPEVVAHCETGWLAPTYDIAQLAAYLALAIENPEQTYQMGLAGRERVKALFTWDKTADVILNGLA
jgi:glycosyltransferase involved in cell wall biosynthesis